jgi:hypothetical protein
MVGPGSARPEGPTDNYVAAQQEFIGLIDHVRESTVLDLPDLSAMVDHQGGTTRGVEEVLATPNDRVFLSPKFYEFIGDTALPDRLSFATQDILGVGKGDSQHQVFFGLMQGQHLDARPDFNGHIVAKPIKSTPSVKARLFHEVAMYQHIANEGLPTLDVLGVALFDSPREKLAGFVMTTYDRDIDMLDSLDWAKMDPETAWDYVGKALEYEALLVDRLLFHGDPEFKNIAIGTKEDALKVVDLESTASLRDCSDEVDRIKTFLSSDLAQIALSVDRFVFKYLPEDQQPKNDMDRFDILHKRVYEPFYERLQRHDGEHLDILSEAYERMVKSKLAMARGEQNW